MYNKLVRDRIPEIMEARGKQYEIETLMTDADFEHALRQKLLEEADEAQMALNRDELVKELADLQEVIDVLADLNQIARADIETLQAQRRAERGGFVKRLRLVWGEKD